MIRKLTGIVEAITPICHFGDEKTGSTPILRSLTVWDPEQEQHVRMPFISGNAVRGILRRLCMRDFLERLAWVDDSVKLHHALFTGGLLESTTEASGKLDLQLRRVIRDALPPLALFGSAIGNQIIDSCLKVGHMMPICREYAANLRDVGDPRKRESIRTFTEQCFATRRDDLRAEREEDEQARQMKIEFEVFTAGTAFRHSFTLVYANEVEAACLAHVLELWTLQPFIGGKSSSGYGEIKWEYTPEISPEPYRLWLAEEENVAKAQGALEAVKALVEGGKKLQGEIDLIAALSEGLSEEG